MKIICRVAEVRRAAKLYSVTLFVWNKLDHCTNGAENVHLRL
jgi:hypothetical protein